MSKGANLDSRFRVEAMRKFFSIRRKIEEEEDDRRDTRSPCANSRVIFSRIALNMLPRARMVITAIYCRSMSSFYADTERSAFGRTRDRWKNERKNVAR